MCFREASFVIHIIFIIYYYYYVLHIIKIYELGCWPLSDHIIIIIFMSYHDDHEWNCISFDPNISVSNCNGPKSSYLPQAGSFLQVSYISISDFIIIDATFTAAVGAHKLV